MREILRNLLIWGPLSAVVYADWREMLIVASMATVEPTPRLIYALFYGIPMLLTVFVWSTQGTCLMGVIVLAINLLASADTKDWNGFFALAAIVALVVLFALTRDRRTRHATERQAIDLVRQALARGELLNRFAELVDYQLQRLLPASLAELWAIDPERAELRLVAYGELWLRMRAYRGASAQHLAEVRVLPIAAPAATAQAARTGQPVEVRNLALVGPEFALSRWYAEMAGLLSLFALPLYADDRLVGVLTILRETPQEYSSRDRRLAQVFADLCAAALGGQGRQVAPASAT